MTGGTRPAPDPRPAPPSFPVAPVAVAAALGALCVAGAGTPDALAAQGIGISAGANFAGLAVGLDGARMEAARRSLRKRPGRTKYVLPWTEVRKALVVEGGQLRGEEIKIAIVLVRLRDGRPVLARAGKVFVHDGRRAYPGDVFFSGGGLVPRGAMVRADGVRPAGQIVPGRSLLPRDALFGGGAFEPDGRLIRRSLAKAGIDGKARDALWIAAVPAGTGDRAETPIRPLVVLFEPR